MFERLEAIRILKMHSSTNARRKCLECYLSPAEMNLHGPVVEPRAQKGYNQSETVRVLKGCRRDSGFEFRQCTSLRSRSRFPIQFRRLIHQRIKPRTL